MRLLQVVRTRGGHQSVAMGKSLPSIGFSVPICAKGMSPWGLFHTVASRALERVRTLSHHVLCRSTGRIPTLCLPGGEVKDDVINSGWLGFLGRGSSSHWRPLSCLRGRGAEYMLLGPWSKWEGRLACRDASENRESKISF